MQEGFVSSPGDKGGRAKWEDGGKIAGKNTAENPQGASVLE